MIQDAIEVLVYAAALDVYRRRNRGELVLTESIAPSRGKFVSAMLRAVDWEARPLCLTRDPS